MEIVLVQISEEVIGVTIAALDIDGKTAYFKVRGLYGKDVAYLPRPIQSMQNESICS